MWYNPIVQGLLRSPLHGFMSGSTLLLTFTGRKTGKLYQLPISYGREGDRLWLITHRRKTWWRNLSGGAPVKLWVQGKEVSGVAAVKDVDRESLIRYLQIVYAGIPLGRAATLAPEMVLIEIQPG